jgi:hypothetical protein
VIDIESVEEVDAKATRIVRQKHFLAKWRYDTLTLDIDKASATSSKSSPRLPASSSR